MGEEARYVAQYASVRVQGESFTKVADVLAERGFDMVRATQTERGVLVVPHTKPDRQAAHLFAALDPVETVEKPDEVHDPFALLDSNVLTVNAPNPMSLDVASASLAGAEVDSGLKHVPLSCGECGAVHSEGVVCLIPVWRESSKCCAEHMTIYDHEGPHEALMDGVVTHRWITKVVIEDLQFNAYGTYDECVDE